MNEIMSIANKHNLFVIEDNAQAIGSDFKKSDGSTVKTGTIGTIGCTSFFPSKNLGCYGDGGAIFTNDDDLANTIRQIANHGQSKKYYHDIVGCNSRLDSIQAAVLKIKLKELDNYIESRRNVAKYYDDAFSSLKCYHSFRSDQNMFFINTEGIDRDELNRYLAGAMSHQWLLPCSSRQKMFQNLIVKILITCDCWLTQKFEFTQKWKRTIKTYKH